jgi:mRNA interferase MazF
MGEGGAAMNIGDIFWIQLPSSNGHEQAGRRPAVILQDESYAGNLPLVLAVPLTTVRTAPRFTGTLLIEPTDSNGLSQPSVALVFQLRAIDRNRIRDKIGIVPEDVLADLFSMLDRLMGRQATS